MNAATARPAASALTTAAHAAAHATPCSAGPQSTTAQRDPLGWIHKYYGHVAVLAYLK